LSGGEDYSKASILDLFRMEVQTHSSVLNNSLVGIASGTAGPDVLEAMLRAAHSIKGAARIVALYQAVAVAHAMEDSFVAAQQGQLILQPDHVEVLLKGTDYLLHAADESPPSADQQSAIVAALKNILLRSESTTATKPSEPVAPSTAPLSIPPSPVAASQAVVPHSTPVPAPDGGRAVRVSATSLNRLMGLSGEALVDAGWHLKFERSLRHLQVEYQQVVETVERLQQQMAQAATKDDASAGVLLELQQQSSEYQQHLADRVHAFEVFSLRSDNVLHRLYREAIASRMRPFEDGVQSFPRLVHDISRSLNKKVRFEVQGRETRVDRDILEKLDAPLNHLLRNAIDHGMEFPADRVAVGKNEQGRVVLQAVHKGGMLMVSVSDDGRGIDIERVRRKILQRKLATAEIASKLTDDEVLEFLFLPGFSTAEEVTEFSGRGVGLDVVRTMIQEVTGEIRITTRPGAGSTFHLQLPITLSVLNALLVEISGDLYAFPLARIEKVLRIEKDQILSLENRPYFKLEGANIGLVTVQQALDIDAPLALAGEQPVIVVSGRSERYGVTVDRVLGERKVVVRPLDPRLGRLPNISAASVMEDGAPLLIVDVEDLVQTINRLLTGGSRVDKIFSDESAVAQKRKRVLIVDDSLTVREVERKLLANRGYDVEVAIDGAEGWNTLTAGRFDLVISDVDMPRMNGIELVTRIRGDARYKTLPIMIVSYKDREEDRMRGMEAGANYYLTKSSFHDESLLVAVTELIGEPR
jgi:two-component system sensor histidine kinase and response regulator WspE